MTRRAARALPACLLAALAACSPTTYDGAATTVEVSATVSTLPTGTVAELLPLMQVEVDDLSARVAADSGAGAAAARIQHYWDAITDEVAADHPQLVSDFEFVVRLCHDAAEHRRPANADRAAKNLDTLVDAVLS